MAFGLAMVLVLAGAAVFVYLRLKADLDDRIDASLRARSETLVAASDRPTLADVALEDPEETFAQLLAADGELLDGIGTLREPGLTAAETRRASTGSVTVERHLPGVDGRARMLARPLDDDGSAVVVVGQSLVDRNDALDNVVSSFVVGGLVAILLASVIGYLLASAGLAPVDAMRRRAREISFQRSDQGLPLPAAHDEIRRLGETLNEMLARLRAAFERESRFVADASHELRTPLAVIKTELEGALQIAGPGTPVHASLVAAAEECDRLTQLADDLLVIARATDGLLPIRPEPIEVRELLAGMHQRFADRAEHRDRSIRVDAASSLELNADPDRLRQALGNLIDNALRHGRGDITLVARSASGGVEIDVGDAGPGFPPELAARAFERFARGDPARAGEGVGLGLAIVQAIAEAHDGTVTVVDAPTTTVRLWILNGG